MSSVSASPISPTSMGKKSWPNCNTLINSACIVNALVSGATHRSQTITLSTNAAIRLFSVGKCLYNKEYYPALFRAASFGLLFCSDYRLSFIAVDITLEMFNLYRNSNSNFIGSFRSYYSSSLKPTKKNSLLSFEENTLNPTIIADACKILGLSEKQAQNQETVTKRHDHLISVYTKKQEHVSKVFQEQIEKEIVLINKSYQTLKKFASDFPAEANKKISSTRIIEEIDD